MAPPSPPEWVNLREKIRKVVARGVPQARAVVTVAWPSEEAAEELVRYVDASNDGPDLLAELPAWNKSYGSSEWKNKQTKKDGGGAKTRVRSWQFNLMREVGRLASFEDLSHGREHGFRNVVFLTFHDDGPLDPKGAPALILPPVTMELHSTTYSASGATSFSLSVTFSTATVRTIHGAQLKYAVGKQPLPSEEQWHYGGRWALLPPYSDWEAYVKQTVKDLVLHPDFESLFRGPIRDVVTAWVIPEVKFLPERAGYKREHPKLTQGMTGILGAREAALREERALALSQSAPEPKMGAGEAKTVLAKGGGAQPSSHSVAGGVGVEKPPEQQVGSCAVIDELADDKSKVVGLAGTAPVAKAVASSAAVKGEKAGGGSSSLVGAAHGGANPVPLIAPAGKVTAAALEDAVKARQAADARIEARLIADQAHWMQNKRKRSLPLAATTSRQAQASERKSNLASIRAAMRRGGPQIISPNAPKGMRVEDLTDEGARLIRRVYEQLLNR